MPLPKKPKNLWHANRYKILNLPLKSDVMRTFSILVIIMAFQAFAVAQDTQVFNEIAKSFNNNDAAGISSRFAETLDLNIGSTDGTFGKKQASVVLKDFLDKNKISGFTIKHKGASNERTQYAISSMKTKNKAWSVYVLINTDNKITQLQIEEE